MVDPADLAHEDQGGRHHNQPGNPVIAGLFPECVDWPFTDAPEDQYKQACGRAREDQTNCPGRIRIQDRSPAQAVPAVHQRAGSRGVPESGKGKGHRREPGAFPQAPEKAPSREHDGRGGHINGDVVDRVARLGEPVGCRWIRIESGANHAGELGVDVGLEVNDVPNRGQCRQGEHEPGPDPDAPSLRGF